MTQKQMEDMKSHCMTTLENLGASEEIIKFYSEALQCEYDISHTIYKLQSKLKNEVDASGSLQPNVIFGILQTMTKHFRNWKSTLENLSEQGITVQPLHLDQQHLSKLKMLTAVCSMDTNQMNLKEGEQLQITDASHPNWLKVRNVHGKEGFLPAMSCLIPTPDNSAITAVERLQVLLLTSWTECIRELRSILASTCVNSSQDLNQKWGSFLMSSNCPLGGKLKEKMNGRFRRIMDCSSRSNANLDLNRFHIFLSKLENDLLNIAPSNNGLAVILRSVEGLDRAVLCYQSLFGQWASFRRGLNESSRPIRIVEQWEELRRAARFKQFKYYEMKMTLEEIDVAEEIVYINSETGETYTSECRKKRQKVVAEELKTTRQEEKKKFVIKGVIDPRSGDRIAFKHAVADGVVDHKRGLYVNPETGEGIPIQRAMLEGRIVVEYTSVYKTSPEITAVPLITVRKRTDCKYVVKGAIDPRTAERVSVEEAIERGLIDPETKEFINENQGGERIPENVAVEDGWILADFDDSKPLYETETFAVNGVLDEKLGIYISFMQAVRRGLLDPETGNYVSSLTGKRVYAADAIRRGLIRAQRSLTNSPENSPIKALDGPSSLQEAITSTSSSHHDNSTTHDSDTLLQRSSTAASVIVPNGDLNISSTSEDLPPLINFQQTNNHFPSPIHVQKVENLDKFSKTIS